MSPRHVTFIQKQAQRIACPIGRAFFLRFFPKPSRSASTVPDCMRLSTLPYESWERLPGESGAAFAAFCAFRDLGLERNIRKAVDSVEKDKAVRLALSVCQTFFCCINFHFGVYIRMCKDLFNTLNPYIPTLNIRLFL